ncbi:MAG: DNA polymerase III subunit delta [Mariprofundaceae bacterium]
MKLRPEQILQAEHVCYYLTGEDTDMVFEAAEKLLNAGDSHVIHLRVDISELSRIESESRNQSLFGASTCYAMVRNAESASPKQTEQLLQLIASLSAPHRLIICAASISWKKLLHKKVQAINTVACCEFHQPDTASFQRWLQTELSQAGLQVDAQCLPQIAEQLCGMRLAAKQWIERLLWYDDGKQLALTQEVMTALLGERAPGDLDEWVHAVAMKDSHSLLLGSRLLRDQNISVVQMHAWLSTRMQQLLLYHWFQAKRHSNPLQAAKVFGEARKFLPEEARHWKGAELTAAIAGLQKVESLLKGASVEDKFIVFERLILHMIA